jgi:hypothetical protein
VRCRHSPRYSRRHPDARRRPPPPARRHIFASGLAFLNSLAFNSAGNLFANNGKDIDEFTPGGVESTFASGSVAPFAVGLAFNSVGNLFVSDSSGNIYEFTPGGVQSTFASGLNVPYGLAVNSAGDLFEADYNTGNIYEFTPGGARSTFASGLNNPEGLAFDSAGDLFATSGNSILEFTPGGTKSTFAADVSGITAPYGLAFQPVPEPSALGLLVVGVTTLLVHRRRKLAT